MTKVFISHAWEDKALVRRLENELEAAGADIWVDHSGVRGGDNLPERISDALKWCNTLLLIWSNAAHNSHWVKLEWTNAIALKKVIVPCILDSTELPSILANTLYLDFRNIEHGIEQLLHALNLSHKPATLATLREVDEWTQELQTKLPNVRTTVKSKPSQLDENIQKGILPKAEPSSAIQNKRGKIVIGLCFGVVLGLFDGLTALLEPSIANSPEVEKTMFGIIIGSSVKGLIAGLIIGFFARKVKSLKRGILFGGAVGLALAFLVAAMPDPSGKHYWLQIMMPGTIVGIILGYITQRYGRET